jgi:hypothetical protein
MVKQNVQDALKKYQETKNKDYENTYKWTQRRLQ